MAIAIVGTPTSYTEATVSTTAVNNVPTGVYNGLLLVWTLTIQNATVPATPSGWTLLQSGTTTGHAQVVWYRTAASEPASYTATTVSARKASGMVALAGVDMAAIFDVTTPAVVVGTTTIGFNAVTTVTPGAWVFGSGSVNTATAANTVTTANLDAIDVQNKSTAGGAVTNVTFGLGHKLNAAPALYTPTMASTDTAIRSLGITFALRPAKGQRIRVVGQAVNRAGSF